MWSRKQGLRLAFFLQSCPIHVRPLRLPAVLRLCHTSLLGLAKQQRTPGILCGDGKSQCEAAWCDMQAYQVGCRELFKAENGWTIKPLSFQCPVAVGQPLARQVTEKRRGKMVNIISASPRRGDCSLNGPRALTGQKTTNSAQDGFCRITKTKDPTLAFLGATRSGISKRSTV